MEPGKYISGIVVNLLHYSFDFNSSASDLPVDDVCLKNTIIIRNF